MRGCFLVSDAVAGVVGRRFALQPVKWVQELDDGMVQIACPERSGDLIDASFLVDRTEENPCS